MTGPARRAGRSGEILARIVLWAGTTIGILVGLAWLLGVHWNTSPSLPLGLYRTAPPDTLRPGDLVMYCPEVPFGRLARARGYIHAGDCPGGLAPVGKPILGLAGDRIEHTRRFVVLNGDTLPQSRTAERDSHGRPLPHPPFARHRLAEGQLWLHSRYHPNALDSRYSGPIRREHVRAVLIPFWVRS